MAYVLPFIAEVVETGPLLYNTDPVSDQGKVLPVGSIRVRPVVSGQKGNLVLHYARPLTLTVGTPPLNGEHVLVFPAPSIDESSGDNYHASFYYFPFPVNITDDAVVNQLPDYNFQIPPKKAGGGGGGRSTPSLPVRPGKTFPFPVRPVRPLQPYEGDFILQNRSGTAIRLGNGTKTNSQYAEQPEHHATPTTGSPFFAITCDEPNGPKLRPLVEIAKAVAPLMNFPGLKKASQKYRTESLKRIMTGMYGGLSLQLPNIILARSCHTNPIILGGALPIPDYKKPQIALDSDRIVLNAKRDNAFMLARKNAIIEGNKVWLVTARHKVDVDELVDELYALTLELSKLTSGLAFFATPVGPTGPSTNLLSVAAILKRILSNLRHNGACPPLSNGGDPSSPPADFGVNITDEGYGNKNLPTPSGPDILDSPLSPDNTSTGISILVPNPETTEIFGNFGGGPTSPTVGPGVTLSGPGGTLIGPGGTLLGPGGIINGQPGQVTGPGGGITGPLGGSTGPGGGITGPGGGVPGPGGSVPNLGTGPGTGTPPAGSGGGGGGGSPIEECKYTLHLIDSENNGWNDSSITVRVDDEIIGTYTVSTRSTVKEFKVKSGSKIDLTYNKSGVDDENFYILSLDKEVLYEDGPSPQPGKVYAHVCKKGPVPVDTPIQVEPIPTVSNIVQEIISLATSPKDSVPVTVYELRTTSSNPDTGRVKEENFLLGLITANVSEQGWHFIQTSPTKFIPSPKTLLTSDKLADISCITRELKNKPGCSSIIFTSATIHKLPYSITVNTRER